MPSRRANNSCRASAIIGSGRIFFGDGRKSGLRFVQVIQRAFQAGDGERFYADDEERTKHAAEWPKDSIPPKEKPPFNRDWRLPKGPF